MYQQKVKEKEKKIADLANKLQAQEARINQLREQAESQPTHSLDEAVESWQMLKMRSRRHIATCWRQSNG